MIRLKTLIIGGLLFLMCGFAPTLASAIPMADILYLEEDLGGGHWRYNYTVYNKSDPVADAGVDLFDIFFYFDPVVTLTVASLPAGWASFNDLDPTQGTSSFLNPYSLIPPEGNDIFPGDFLGGFVFDFDRRVGDLLFDVAFLNPEGGDSHVYSGTTAPVPEPATILLMTVGMVGIGVAGRKRARKSKG
jgi:hypothetical protein